MKDAFIHVLEALRLTDTALLKRIGPQRITAVPGPVPHKRRAGSAFAGQALPARLVPVGHELLASFFGLARRVPTSACSAVP